MFVNCLSHYPPVIVLPSKDSFGLCLREDEHDTGLCSLSVHANSGFKKRMCDRCLVEVWEKALKWF